MAFGHGRIEYLFYVPPPMIRDLTANRSVHVAGTFN